MDDKPSRTGLASGDPQGTGVSAASRRPYHRPALYTYGDVRQVTLGASPGAGDSGSYKIKNPKIGLYGQYGGLP